MAPPAALNSRETLQHDTSFPSGKQSLESTATASQIHLSPKELGLIRSGENSAGSLEAASKYLQRNHDEHHMFWREVAGHNHISHSVLSVFALGGTPADIERAFEDGADIQRPVPQPDPTVVEGLSDPAKFLATVGHLEEYPNLLAFFVKEIDAKGAVAVIREYVFGKTPVAEKLFALLFEGLYHPIIHVGLGVEFGQPSIVAEGLAQAASHDSMGFEDYLFRSEKAAQTSTKRNQPLVQLLHAVRANDSLRNGPFGFVNGPDRVREGILGGKNGDLLVDLAAQYRVKPDELERSLAETINSSAFASGGHVRPGKARKIDFFYLHMVTASVALAVLLRQSWISPAEKVRLVEWKARVDLVWYGASAAVELRVDSITGYQPERSAGWDWDRLCREVLSVHDDGHLAKLIRGLKLGQELSKPFEQEGDATFPVQGEAWFKVAQLAYDTTVDREVLQKWVWGAGFEECWAHVPATA